ncbi:hypothetical protein N9153_03280 [Planctomicrobium sp.]|jgi:hypothetical protein|nr:hypothetical protein [Planctomicrobium sp.]MDB4439927.1 hypothetical protein [Planctomicrobium sp.]
MSNLHETQDGVILKFQRNDDDSHNNHQIDEQQFENWQRRWDTKEEVIDQLLEELEKSMSHSQHTQQKCEVDVTVLT